MNGRARGGLKLVYRGIITWILRLVASLDFEEI
jgi:hypothetical protein